MIKSLNLLILKIKAQCLKAKILDYFDLRSLYIFYSEIKMMAAKILSNFDNKWNLRTSPVLMKDA